MRQAKIGILVGSGLVISIGLGWWFLHRPPAITDQSISLVKALYNCQPGPLLELASEREKKVNRLTEEKVQQLLDRLIRPYAGDQWEITSAASEEGMNGDQGFSDLVLINKQDRRKVELHIEVLRAADGRHIQLLPDICGASANLRFHNIPNVSPDVDDYFVNNYRVIKENQSFLDSLGVKYFVSLNPDQKPQTLEKILNNCRINYAKRHSTPFPVP